MQTTYDLTAGSRKGELQLYVSPKSFAFGVTEAGIKVKPVKYAVSSHGYYFSLTTAQARRLVEKFASKVTYYGKPLA
jgi:hypothetical protein